MSMIVIFDCVAHGGKCISKVLEPGPILAQPRRASGIAPVIIAPKARAGLTDAHAPDALADHDATSKHTISLF